MKKPLLVSPLITAVAVLTACGGPPADTQPSGAASVGADTTPEDVVRSYLGALQEDDESAAVSLTTAPYSERDSWAGDPPSIEDVEVLDAVAESPEGTAAEGRYEQAVYVPVRFTLHGADESMPDGPTAWGYQLVRNTDAEAWKIADAGM
ncbi:hypothetical protein [Kineococcus sp. SYSU DK001]|uniref:hypothetical protein n=1 Tax=Kineococcus sp. SYSU DK001 TaxID=3383122 RepID=UPI003D7F02CE